MRTITGTVLTVDGLPVASTEVSFTLVDNKVLPTSSFDAATHERVYGTKSTTTDANGTFTISLYENSKLIDITSYLVRVDVANDVPFSASLTEGVAAIDWLVFKAGGVAITVAELNLISDYLASGEAIGDSAYEIAVTNGFVGTEVQWLASLQGVDGIDGVNAVAITLANYNLITPPPPIDDPTLYVING